MKSDDEFASEMSEMIMDAINSEVIEDAIGADLIRQGWTQVHRNFPWSEPNPYLWHHWFDTNINGRYRAFDHVIYFHDEKDAVLYKLRWS